MNLTKCLLSPVTFDLHGFKAEGAAILIIPLLIAIIGGVLASFVWLYRDAARRNKNGLVCILFIILSGWPASFIWWLWLRPPLDGDLMRSREQGSRGGRRAGDGGFTLMEILLVVVIIGILATIAYPSYQNHVRKANRANAQALMMDLVNKQQIYLSTARAYAPSPTDLIPALPTDVTKHYAIAITLVAGPPPAFSIRATPTSSSQAVDGWVDIDSAGNKTSEHPHKW